MFRDTIGRFRLTKRASLAGGAAAGIAVVLAAAALLRSGPEESAADPVSTAYHLAASGEIHRAIDSLEAAFTARARADVRLALARLQVAAGRSQQALGTLDAPVDGGTETDGGYARELRLLKAEALLRLGRLDEVETLLGAGEGGAIDGAAALLVARAAFAAGDLDGADAAVMAALRREGPWRKDAWLLRARLALFQDQNALADAAAARAGEAGAEKGDIALLKVFAAIQQDDLTAGEEALAAWSVEDRDQGRGQDIDPRREYAAALVDIAAERPEEAARRLGKIAVFLESDPIAPVVMATAQAMSGNANLAESTLRAGVREFSNNPYITAVYAEFLLDAGRDGEAAAELARTAHMPASEASRADLSAAIAAGDADAMINAVGAGACREEVSWPSKRFPVGNQSAGSGRAAIAARLCSFAGAPATADASHSVPQDASGAAMLALAGRNAIAAGEDHAAGDLFVRSSALDPHSYEAVLGVARVAVRSGNPVTASAQVNAYAASRPQDLSAQVLLAGVAISSNNTAEAVKALEGIEALLPANSGVGAAYLRLLQETGDDRRLARFSERLRRMDPVSPLTVEALLAAGRVDHATAAARMRVLSMPESPEAAMLYQRVMGERGRGEAAKAFLASIGRDTSPDADENPAKTGGIPKKYALTKEMFEKAAYRYAVDPTNPEVLYQYGSALRQAGKKELSLRVMREAEFWAPLYGEPTESGSGS